VGLYEWFFGNNGGRTQAVGGKTPNAYGLYDVGGNVLEWTLDWYNSSYPSGSATDYTGPSSGANRTARGGGLSLDAADLRLARRDFSVTTYRNRDIGLRLARTVP
jgi:formylglycine-generating enzyme required for sulfatase activity